MIMRLIFKQAFSYILLRSTNDGNNIMMYNRVYFTRSNTTLL